MMDQSVIAGVLDLVPFGVYVVEVRSLRVAYVNRHFQEREGAVPGALCYQVLYGQDRPCLACRIRDLTDAHGQPNGQTVTSERFDEMDDRWYQIHEGTIAVADGRVLKYAITVDIGETKRIQNDLAEAHAELALKNQQLEKISVLDRLTGLYNRRKLDESLQHAMDRVARTKAPLSVILADIDHFKKVNDSFGHQVGDEVLIGVAGLVRAGIRAVDVVGRWGGEEFMILCSDTNLAGARLVAEKLRGMIERHTFGAAGHVTSSFGVAAYVPGEPVHALIKRADQALYEAKGKGRNRVEIMPPSEPAPVAR